MADLTQIISVALTVTSILVAVWIYARSRQYRSISCIYDPLVSPVEISAADAIKGDLEIRYRKKPVKNIFIARMKLKNSGTLPIRDTNIVDPISFTFPGKTRFLSTPTVIDEKPSSLGILCVPAALSASGYSNKATVQFALLNPEDEFTLEFICTGVNRYPEVSGHIEGVKEIKIVDPDALYKRSRRISRGATIAAGILGILVAALSIAPIWARISCNAQRPPGAILFFQPDSTAAVGQAVLISGAATNGGACFRAMRLEIDNKILYEITSPFFVYKWDTSASTPGEHILKIEVAKQGDDDWTNTAPVLYKYDLK